MVGTTSPRRVSIRARPATTAASIVAAVAVAAAVGVPALAVEGDAGTEHPLLQQARRNVEEVTARLADAEGDRAAAAEALASVEDELAGVEQAVNDAALAVERQELEVQAAARRLEELRAEVEEIDARLRQRAIERYMGGGGAALDVVLAAGDVQEAVDRSSYLDFADAADRTSREASCTARTRLAAEAARFDLESARLARMLDEQRALLAEVEQLREVRAAALRDAQQEVDDLERMEDDLSGDYERVATLIAEARSTPVAASPPSAAGYGWPVCRTVTSRFGYRWGRQHKGIDVAGDVGDPIAAAKAGVVIFAGRQGGYGNLVLIDHGDGVVTAYAHQSEMIVVPGQSVARGERIGSVGNTGNSTGPHLHFETRVNGHAVDPVQFLPDSC